MKKQLLSILLCLCMAMNLLSLPAWALDPTHVQLGGVTLQKNMFYTVENDVITAHSEAPITGDYFQYDVNVDTDHAEIMVFGNVSYNGSMNGLFVDHATLSISGMGHLSLISQDGFGMHGQTSSITTNNFNGSIHVESKLSHAILGFEDVSLEASETLSIANNSSNATINCQNNLNLTGNQVLLTNGANSQLAVAGGENINIHATGGDLILTGNTPESPILGADCFESGKAGIVTLTASGDVQVTNNGNGSAIRSKLVVTSAENLTVLGGNKAAIDGAAELSVNGDIQISNTGFEPAIVKELNITKAENVTISSTGQTPTLNGITNITANGNITIKNTLNGIAVGNDITATSTSGSIHVSNTVQNVPAITGNATLTADQDIIITSAFAIDIAGAATLNAAHGMIFRTTQSGTTITKNGVTIDAAYGGDVSATGLNLSGKNASGDIDSQFNLPTQKTLYKAGSGYLLFTPKTGTENAQLNLNQAQITTSSTIIILPETEPVDFLINGNVELTSTGSGDVIRTNGQPLMIIGEGNLSLSGNYQGVSVNGLAPVNIQLKGDMTFKTNYQPISTAGDISISADNITTLDSGYFYGANITLNATEGDIQLNAKKSYSGAVNGQAIQLIASKGAIAINNAETDDSYAVKGTTIDIQALKDIDINSSKGGLYTSGGSVALASETGGITINVKAYQNISATNHNVTLNAVKDINFINDYNNDSSASSGIFGTTTQITTLGNFSSISDYGLQVSDLIIKAKEVTLEGTEQDTIQANSVTITNPEGNNCEKVSLISTSPYNNRAAVTAGGDVLIKSDDIFICGNNQAKAIIAQKNVTIGDRGLILGEMAISGTSDIASGILKGKNGGDISATGLDLKTPPTETTVYTAGTGYALYQPASGQLPSSLTLHNATIEANHPNQVLNLDAISTLKLEGVNSITNNNASISAVMATDGNAHLTIEGTATDTLELNGYFGMLLESLTVSGSKLLISSEASAISVLGNLNLKDGADVLLNGSENNEVLRIMANNSGTGNLTLDGGSRLTLSNDSLISNSLSVLNGSTVTVKSERMSVGKDVLISGSQSRLMINEPSTFKTGGSLTLSDGAKIVNNGILAFLSEMTSDTIKALNLLGNGLVKVATKIDVEGGVSNWKTYSQDGIALFEINDLDLNTGDHSTKTIESDGYTFANNTLTLGNNTLIDGYLELPDQASIQTAENTIIQGSIQFKGNYPCDLTITGNGHLTV